MTFSNIISKEHDLTIPTPTLSTEPYPTASPPKLSAQVIELRIDSERKKEGERRSCSMTLKRNEQTVYSYHEQTLYSASGQTVWCVVKRESEGLRLNHPQERRQMLLSTNEFWFSLGDERYQWKLIPFKEGSSYSLNCYRQQQLVAQLNESLFRIDTAYEETERNPFKVQDTVWVSSLLISGLMIHEDLQCLLSYNPDALKTLLCLNRSFTELEDDTSSIISGDLRHHDAGGLVENSYANHRASSFRSIELNPGLWHGWQKLWWSCFPCCMPGGCCDRACVHLRHHPRSRQGWQQHY